MTRISIEDHRQRLLARIPNPRVETRPLAACLGLVLAQDVRAQLPLPPFTNSAMDGFAYASSDVKSTGPHHFVVAGDIAAGDTQHHVHVQGQVWRIMTGAMMPEGCDTVIKVEDTDHDGLGEAPSEVTFHVLPEAGANVRLRGEALAPGERVFSQGQVLDATALSACASIGFGELPVYVPPRVMVVTTGSELVAPGISVLPGQIPDSNGLLLAGLVQEAGADVVATLRISDDVAAFSSALNAAVDDADLVLTVGGISAGAYEVVRQALVDTTDFYAVAQQPGGPQGSGVIQTSSGRDVLVICMPGNPVSVFVSFHLYVREVLARITGLPELVIPQGIVHGVGTAIAHVGWRSPKAKTQFMPVAIEGWDIKEGRQVARVAPVHVLGSRSHLVVSLAEADGLAVVDEGIGQVEAGDQVGFLPVRQPHLPPAQLPRVGVF